MTDVMAPALGAGWYPDPANDARARWWDGSGWTEHTAALPESDEVATQTAQTSVAAELPHPSLIQEALQTARAGAHEQSAFELPLTEQLPSTGRHAAPGNIDPLAFAVPTEGFDFQRIPRHRALESAVA